MLAMQFVTALTDVFASIQEGVLGAIRIENSKVYKYVKFSGTTTVAAGDIVNYVNTDTGNTTVDGANSGVLVGAGVAMAAVASGAVQFGWIQIGGVATLSTAIAGTTPAVGNLVTSTGATAPAALKRAAVTDNIIGTIVHVANKIVALSCPW